MSPSERVTCEHSPSPKRSRFHSQKWPGTGRTFKSGCLTWFLLTGVNSPSLGGKMGTPSQVLVLRLYLDFLVFVQSNVHKMFKWATKKKALTFQYTGCLIVIFVSWFMKYSPHNWVVFHSLQKNLNNHLCPFFHCSNAPIWEFSPPSCKKLACNWAPKVRSTKATLPWSQIADHADLRSINSPALFGGMGKTHTLGESL